MQADSLRSGVTQSCGCFQRERISETAKISSRKHGMRGSSEYRAWQSMLSRCHNPNATGYERYGGRGITVCDRWRDNFESFFADMGARPSLSHTIDRIDNDRGYGPDNCRWATKAEQGSNKRDSVIVRGERMSLTRACKEFGDVVSRHRARERIASGWSVEEAVSTRSRQR